MYESVARAAEGEMGQSLQGIIGSSWNIWRSSVDAAIKHTKECFI